MIDKKSGIITSYKSDGKELLLKGYGPRPAFWRPPTDNDYGWRIPKVFQLWKFASVESLVAESIKTSQRGNAVHVEVVYKLDSVKSTWKTQYTVMGNGAVNVENILVTTDSTLSFIPRVGMKMQIPKEYTQLEYLGRGPWGNYCDRKSSKLLVVMNQLLLNCSYRIFALRKMDTGQMCAG